MTHIAALDSTNMNLAVEAPRCGETVTGRDFRTIPGCKGVARPPTPAELCRSPTQRLRSHVSLVPQ